MTQKANDDENDLFTRVYNAEQPENQEPGTLQVFVVRENAKLPTKLYKSDAPVDFYSFEEVTIEAGSFEEIRTGVCIILPLGVHGKLFPTYKAAKRGLYCQPTIVNPEFTFYNREP